MNLITSNKLTMSSREIAELTGKQVSHVHRDFKVMADELEFPIESTIGNRLLMPSPDMDLGFSYDLDAQNRIHGINLNRELTLTLVSGYNVKLRHAIIKRWQDLESKQAFQIPQTLGEALQLAADQAKQLELAAPKVAFVDNLVTRHNLLNATQVGQPHKISAMKLNKLLDEFGGVYNKTVKRGRAFCQPWINKGYGEMKIGDSGHNQCLFTTLGEQRINEILISEGVL